MVLIFKGRYHGQGYDDISEEGWVSYSVVLNRVMKSIHPRYLSEGLHAGTDQKRL